MPLNATVCHRGCCTRRLLASSQKNPSFGTRSTRACSALDAFGVIPGVGVLGASAKVAKYARLFGSTLHYGGDASDFKALLAFWKEARGTSQNAEALYALFGIGRGCSGLAGPQTGPPAE
jgi:hypothetical protein